MKKILLPIAVAGLSIGVAFADTATVLDVKPVLGAQSDATNCPPAAPSGANLVAPAVVVGALLGAGAGAAIAHAPAFHLGLNAVRNAAIGGAFIGGAVAGQAAANRSVPGAGPVLGYEVTYSYQGKAHRQVLSYDPGNQVEVDPNGRAIGLPYDNPFPPARPKPIELKSELSSAAAQVNTPPPQVYQPIVVESLEKATVHRKPASKKVRKKVKRVPCEPGSPEGK